METSNEKRIGFVAFSLYESEIKASRTLRQDGYNLTFLVNSIFQFNSYIDLLEEEKIKAITKL